MIQFLGSVIEGLGVIWKVMQGHMHGTAVTSQKTEVVDIVSTSVCYLVSAYS